MCDAYTARLLRRLTKAYMLPSASASSSVLLGSGTAAINTRVDEVSFALPPPGGPWTDSLGANPHHGKGAGIQHLAMSRDSERRGSDETTVRTLVTDADDPVKGVGDDPIEITPLTARPRVLKYPRDLRPGDVTGGEQGFVSGRDIESDTKDITDNRTRRGDPHFDGKEVGCGIVNHDVPEDSRSQIMDEIREGEGRGGT